MENLKLVWRDLVTLLCHDSISYVFALVVLIYDTIRYFNGTLGLNDIFSDVLLICVLLISDFFWYDKLRNFGENKP